MATAENIEAALKEAERVCKKQKICADKTAKSIDKLAETLLAAALDLPDHVIGREATNELSLNNAQDLLKDLTESTKDLHSAVNKLGKVCITFWALGQGASAKVLMHIHKPFASDFNCFL